MQNSPMKKNIVQDVVPPKRSIRSINLPPRRRSQNIVQEDIKPSRIKKPISSDSVYLEKNIPAEINYIPKKIEAEPETPPYSYEYDEPVKSSRKGLYISVVIFIIAFAFGVSALFKSAKVTLTPRHQTYALNSTFTAKKDDTGNNLAFQIVTISKDQEKTVSATGESKVLKKAEGKIVIFNNYSNQPQKLVATTRFETPEGLVFRLVSATNVPGTQVKAGKTIPGSIEATVQADVAGDKYNIALKDFVVPGFKGDPRYTKIFARSKTAMSGGFSGMQKVVSADIASSTNTELEDNLKATLSSDIISQIPSNFVLYPGGLSYSFSPTSQVGTNENGAVLQKKGTAYAIIFDKGSLSRAISTNALPDSSNDVIKITNLDKLVFSYPDGKSFDPASGETTLDFNLSGETNFVWVFDENKLKSDLLGLSKKQAKDVISKYASITEYWLEISPFWNQTIPTDPKKVNLINTLAQ